MSILRTRTRLLTCCVLASLAGCASAPLASPEEDAASKTFAPPPEGKAGLYVFRNHWLGHALIKTVYLDGQPIGDTGNKMFLHRFVEPGPHKLSSESEFGNDDLEWTAVAGENHFFRQYIKMGVFSGGSNLEAVGAEEGKKEVLECKLGAAVPGDGTP